MTRSTTTRIAIALACALAGRAQTSAPATVYRFVQDWQAFVPQKASEAASDYRAAICPDGSAYISDGEDRVINVDYHGQILFDQRNLPDIRSVLAMTCDAGSRLAAITARPRLINVIQPMSGALVRTSSYALESALTPRRMVAAGMGYIVLGADPAGTKPLRLLGQTGNEEIAFGPRPLDDSGSALRAMARGSIAWDARRQHLVFAPESPYHLYSFSPAGQLLREADVGGATFQSTITDWATGMPLPGDAVQNLALLPSGEVAVEVIRTRPSNSGTLERTQTVELLDAAFQVVARIGNPPGELQGADDQGNLYFTRSVVGAGVYETRLHIEPQP